MRRTQIASILGVVCLALVACGRSPAYETTEVAKGDVRDVVPAVGAIKPLSRIEVRADAPGRVVAVLVQPNARITAGQVLARIQPDRLALDVDQARAESRSAEAAVVEAKARAEQADRALANRSTLAAQGFISPAALNDAQSAARAGRAAVARAEAEAARAAVRVSAAASALGDVLVRAPADGFVLSRAVEVGQVVAPSAETPLFVVASDTERVLIEAKVAEPDIARITPDAGIAFSVEAYPGQTFQGRLRQVLRDPQAERNFVSYPVLIEADNQDGRLFPGMTASVEFIHADARNVLRIPIDALYFVPKGYEPVLPQPLIDRLKRRGLLTRDARAAAEMGILFAGRKQRVFVLEGGRPRMRAVSLGAETADFVEIRDGLALGERVVTGPASLAEPLE